MPTNKRVIGVKRTGDGYLATSLDTGLQVSGATQEAAVGRLLKTMSQHYAMQYESARPLTEDDIEVHGDDAD